MTDAELKDLNAWIREQLASHDFGEVHVTLKLHRGRPVILETSVVERVQLTGRTGDRNEKSSL